MPAKASKKPTSAKFIPTEKVAALLAAPAAAGYARDAHLLAALFYLGLRVGEAVLLKPEYFRLEHGCVMVPTLKKRHRNASGEKIGPVLLEVPVLAGEGALAALAAWAHGRVWCFPGGRRGRPITTRTAESIFRVWAASVRLDPEATPHSLRHTACSLIAARTKDPVLVRDFARHSNISISDTYIHALPERWHAARGALELPGAARHE